jgi:uncharacterized phage protein (TIGR02218 family)
MTFAQYEESTEGSRPIEVVRFVLGADTFDYTSAEDEVTVDGITYSPIALKRSKIGQSPEDREQVVDFTVSGDNTFARRYINVVPGSRATCTVKRVQRTDFPGPESITLFSGLVKSVKFTQDGSLAKIATQSIAAARSRSIPRFTYQGLCNHVLYDSGCKVDDTNAAFRHNGNVLTATGNTITVAGADGFANGFFTGGFVEILGGQDIRPVLAHTGTSLTILLPFASDPVGTSATVLAGCDHTISTCDTKFFTSEDLTSNVINFGGFRFIPTKNIFSNGL